VLQRDGIAMGEEVLESNPDAEVLKWQRTLSLVVRLAHRRDVVEFCHSPTREGTDVIEMHNLAIGNGMSRGKTFSPMNFQDALLLVVIQLPSKRDSHSDPQIGGIREWEH
jgi:hypothetical protein